MKMLLFFAVLFAALFLFTSGCKREISCEDCQSSFADGQLLCDSFILHGTYAAGAIFTDTNYIQASVTVATPGAYVISSNTINGYYFYDAGNFATAGVQQVILKAYGGVSTEDTSTFTFYFRNSACTHTVLPAQAAYTFAATGGNCDNNVVYGSYTAGEALSAKDSVAVQVNVTAPGSYSLQSPEVNGITFAAHGVFAHIGLQTITLHGAGTPQQSATYNIPLAANSSSCGFLVVVNAKVVYPAMYYSFEADGIAYFGTLDSAHLTYQAVSGNNISGLSFRSLLVTPFDTTFSLAVFRTNMSITTGTYHAALSISEDYAGGVNFAVNNDFIYGSTQYYPSFQIFLTQYGLADKLVQGGFSGPVVNGENKVINITGGKFKTYLAQ